MTFRSNVLIAGYVLMLAFGVGYIISCWMATSATDSTREGFLMAWNSVMMIATLLQMMYWRVFHAGSNLFVGITLSMMGFMSLQAVLAAATYVKGNDDAVYGDAIASFGILYAFTTITHVILMAVWRHGEEEAYGDESGVVDKKEYEQVGTAPSTST
uniref:Uncharacterized protein n=1 Tax=Lotharella oceanica TaxID=641309 RepID=A0A7S2TVH9_9EUKA|mmetsp:Transcript_31763/g.59191  ORF Transcript_31763/g.59191 Transcript_31763/m.59191 type:complete len:157 (+) Transcript_31763:21-491(+)|eukprot:CAMPEP_0170171774 /NCGR_PEP_ID=MMETSP0040_2-20121228/4954_1 /TAXON_ID=641309 /ORGANISM="Lotharella oceanica, Strain CCMP622" /LENGTH=156 /DNA_ID=CAMNT_0010412025 /DNA_START=22 /DNA_END=492 /DNA_ORIENTATION=-